jgi:hypothetical protein
LIQSNLKFFCSFLFLACINVLEFLISFLSHGKKNMKEGEQVSNDIADKAGMRREFFFCGIV